MAGPIARTQPNPEDRPQQVGNLQPDVPRQADDAPAADLAERRPHPEAEPLHKADEHPQPGVSSGLNTGTTPPSPGQR